MNLESSLCFNPPKMTVLYVVSGVSLKVCLHCGNVYSVTPMTKSKDVCPKCKGVLAP